MQGTVTSCINIYATNPTALRKKVDAAIVQVRRQGGIVIDVKFDDRTFLGKPADFFALLVYERPMTEPRAATKGG
jgi:hypothetical protein